VVDCIALFSGAGGLDVGAKQAGARIIRCVEIDDDSVSTLRMNFPDLRIDHGDIATVDFREHQGSRVPKIIIGGPPCQPFSKNGYWVKNENRLIEHDPRNMLSEFLRAVEEARPTGFLFENVESLLHPTNKHVVDFPASCGEPLAKNLFALLQGWVARVVIVDHTPIGCRLFAYLSHNYRCSIRWRTIASPSKHGTALPI